MRIEAIDIPDSFADSLLALFEAEPADFADPGRRAAAMLMLVEHALERLLAEGGTDDGDRHRVTEGLLLLASAARDQPDRRGVPYEIWTPAGGWSQRPGAPAGWRPVESAITALRDRLDLAPRLALFMTARLLPTDETFSEVVIAGAADPVEVTARIGDARYRWRIDPASAIVAGASMGRPERIADRR